MRMLKATQTRKQPRLVTPCLFSTCPIPAIPQALAARGGIRTLPSNVQASLATRPVGRHGVCVAGLLPELGPILPPFSVSSGGTPCNRRKGYPESGEAPLSIWIELWLEPPDCLISAGRPPGRGRHRFPDRNELRELPRSEDYGISGKTSLRIWSRCSAGTGSCQPR